MPQFFTWRNRLRPQQSFCLWSALHCHDQSTLWWTDPTPRAGLVPQHFNSVNLKLVANAPVFYLAQQVPPPTKFLSVVSASLPQSVHLVMDWSHPACRASAPTFQFGEFEIGGKCPSFYLAQQAPPPTKFLRVVGTSLARWVHLVMDWSHPARRASAPTFQFGEFEIGGKCLSFLLGATGSAPNIVLAVVSTSLPRSVHLVMDWSHPARWASAPTFQFGEFEIGGKCPSF